MDRFCNGRVYLEMKVPGIFNLCPCSKNGNSNYNNFIRSCSVTLIMETYVHQLLPSNQIIIQENKLKVPD